MDRYKIFSSLQFVLTNFLYLILYLLYLLNPIFAVTDDRSCDSDDSMGGRGRSCSQISQGNNRTSNEEEASENHYEPVVLKDRSDGNSQEDVSPWIYQSHVNIFSYCLISYIYILGRVDLSKSLLFRSLMD